MSADTKPSRPQEIPHSRSNINDLLGEDLLSAGGFNRDVVSDTRKAGTRDEIELHFGNPEEFGEDPQVIVVGDQWVFQGAVIYHRWWVGSVPGVGRGKREDVEAFDGMVDEILQGPEIPYSELKHWVEGLLLGVHRIEPDIEEVF